MLQHYSADGSKLDTPIDYTDVFYSKLIERTTVELGELKGYVGFDIKSGMAKVVTSSKDKNIRLIRMGKFLKRSGIDDCQVSTISKNANDLYKIAKLELKFTTTSKEVIHVYENSQRSCMTHCDAVAVYATDDVCVGYLEHQGNILARTVIRKKDTLEYYRIYGEEHLMEFKLKELKARRNSYYLNGARVLHLRDSDDLIMMPYLDGDAICIDEPCSHEEFVVIETSGEIACTDTNGRPQGRCCEECGEAVQEDETCWSEYLEQSLCESCFDDCHVFLNGEHYHVDSDDVVETEDDGIQLLEDCCLVECRNEWHLVDDCMYNSYTEEWYLSSDF